MAHDYPYHPNCCVLRITILAELKMRGVALLKIVFIAMRVISWSLLVPPFYLLKIGADLNASL